MRLTASDFMTYWRPSSCELRVFLHEKGEPEAEPGAFDEVMRRLGIRHEQEHLATILNQICPSLKSRIRLRRSAYGSVRESNWNCVPPATVINAFIGPHHQ